MTTPKKLFLPLFLLFATLPSVPAIAVTLHQREIPWDARCHAQASQPGGLHDSGYCKALAYHSFGCRPQTPLKSTLVDHYPQDKKVLHKQSGHLWKCNPVTFSRGINTLFSSSRSH